MMKDIKSLRFIWNQIIRALYAFNCGYNLATSELVVKTINTSDVESAKQLIKIYNICAELPE